jgi:tetratricopeptide (TPR) repeat protein
MNKIRIIILAAAALLSGAFTAAAQEAAELVSGAGADVPKVISPSPLAAAEWDFLKAAGQDKEKDILKMVLPQLDDWLAKNPASPEAPAVLLLKADINFRLGEEEYALVDLLKYFRVYPAAPSLAEAKTLYDTVAKKADKKLKPALDQLTAAPADQAVAFNLSSLLEMLSVEAGKDYYEPLTAEYRAFFNRFPEYSRNDAVRISLAELHRLKGEYLAARLTYEKMIALHAESPLMAAAKQSLGDVLADNLKEYDRAIEVFRDIAASFPGTDQAWYAYGRLPALAEKQKKYGLAVEIYEKIIELYPDKEEAVASHFAEAELQRKKLDKYADAVAVLNRLADKYKGPRAIEALLLAAEIYRKDLKDSAGEIKMYDRISGEYEGDKEAPKALYAAGEIHFKAKDMDNARRYFDKMLMLYPEDSLSRKAASRVADIVAGKL